MQGVSLQFRSSKHTETVFHCLWHVTAKQNAKTLTKRDKIKKKQACDNVAFISIKQCVEKSGKRKRYIHKNTINHFKSMFLATVCKTVGTMLSDQLVGV